jgi:hypothetical protein
LLLIHFQIRQLENRLPHVEAELKDAKNKDESAKKKGGHQGHGGSMEQ